ncbi:MAG: efflux RND transporter periplasmic adaptor subunit [Bryobacteraceae bacterium]|nr:efflux RND transporter periplasmic adaptor subunit [Bryobacteraceae bacterium]
MRMHTLSFAAVLAGGLLFVSGCKHGDSEVKAAVAIPVQTAVVDEVTVDTATHYSATIEPDTTVELAFKVDGYVDSLLKVGQRNVQVGDFIPKGAVLARVRQSDYRASLDAYRAQALQAAEALKAATWQLTQAEAVHKRAVLDAERAEALYVEKALTKPDLDAARADLDSTRAEVEAAKKNVEARRNELESAKAKERASTITFEDTDLVSPMSCVVLEKRVEPGTLVGRGIPVFRLGDVGTVRIAFSVPDTLITSLKLGAPLQVAVDAFPDQLFQGRVREIAAAADPATRLYRVEVALPNTKQQLKTGMMGKVSVQGSQPASLMPAVPALALLRAPSDPNAATVFVIEQSGGNTVARLRTVRLGQFAGSRVTVLAGLAKGDAIVTGGRQNLIDGALVRIAN